MIGSIPKRPTGQGAEAVFMQWIWDNMISFLRAQSVSGDPVSQTTRGRFSIPTKPKGLPSIEVTLCDETGTSQTYIFFGYKKNPPTEVTADSSYVTADVDTITTDS